MSYDWTYERVEMLKTLWADSYTAAEIAEKMPGLSRSAVIGKVHRLKLSGRVRITNVSGTPKRTYKTRIRKHKPAPAATVPNPDAALPPDQSSFAVTFEQLGSRHCRWPIGERPFKYCGAPHVEGGSFCWRHHAIAYQPAMRRSA